MADATTHSTIPHAEGESSAHLFDDWFDPIEAAVRAQVREFIQGLIEDELEATLLRPRYGRLRQADAEEADAPAAIGHRHGRRPRSLMGSFGRDEIEVPRARLAGPDGKTREWQSKVLPLRGFAQTTYVHARWPGMPGGVSNSGARKGWTARRSARAGKDEMMPIRGRDAPAARHTLPRCLDRHRLPRITRMRLCDAPAGMPQGPMRSPPRNGSRSWFSRRCSPPTD